MHILLHIGGGAPGAKYAHAYCAHIGGGGRCILTLTAYAIGVHIDPLKSAYLAKGKPLPIVGNAHRPVYVYIT